MSSMRKWLVVSGLVVLQVMFGQGAMAQEGSKSPISSTWTKQDTKRFVEYATDLHLRAGDPTAQAFFESCLDRLRRVEGRAGASEDFAETVRHLCKTVFIENRIGNAQSAEYRQYLSSYIGYVKASIVEADAIAREADAVAKAKTQRESESRAIEWRKKIRVGDYAKEGLIIGFRENLVQVQQEWCNGFGGNCYNKYPFIPRSNLHPQE